jgi:hypothetical protein
MPRILFLGAAPRDATRLALGREVREIGHSLRESHAGHRIDLVQEWAVRPTDLHAILLRHRPEIVHFSGHGSPDGALCLEDEGDATHPLAPDVLGRLFAAFSGDVRCVVLNACYTEAQGRELSRHVGCVVGMSGAMPDLSAIAFASSFYLALAHGENVATALALGRNQIELAATGRGHRDVDGGEPTPRLAPVDLPFLVIRPGMDAHSIRLFEPSTVRPARPTRHSGIHERALSTVDYIATRLDRTKQWDELSKIVGGPESAVVVLYGPKNMDLPYFAQRMRERLGEPGDAPWVITIPLFQGGVALKTAADLEQRLQEKLAAALKLERGTTDELMAEAASDRPVVVVFGSKPLDDPAPHEKALKEFLRSRAPRLVATARRAVVFFIHAYTIHLAVVRRVAGMRRGLPYVQLEELALPSRDDVEKCLRESDLRPPREVIDVLIQDYKDLIADRPSISLVELSHQLAQKLEELMGD